MGIGTLEIDLERALTRVGGDRELLSGVIAIVIEDTPIRLGELEAALATQQCADVERAAHALRGLVSNVHCQAVQNAALDVEACARANDLPEVARRVADLCDLIRQMTVALERAQRTLGGNGS